MKRDKRLCMLMSACAFALAMRAGAADVHSTVNYDETKVAPYTLEDPLTFADGTKLKSASLTNVFYNIAVLNLSLGFAGVLIGLSPVYVVIIAAFLFKERATRRKLFGMALAIIGVVMVSGVIENGITFTALGLAAGLLSGVFYGMTSIFTKICIGRGYNGLTITFYAVLITALTTAPFANWGQVAEYTAAFPISHSLLMIAHALIGAALPYLMLNVSLRFIEAGKASILTSSEPVSAMLFGAFVYGEKLTVISAAGMAIAVTAFGIISTDRRT